MVKGLQNSFALLPWSQLFGTLFVCLFACLFVLVKIPGDGSDWVLGPCSTSLHYHDTKEIRPTSVETDSVAKCSLF